jgi:hypothetical protein
LLQANYSQNFGAQSAALQNLNNIFTPIAEAGPNQQGFNAQQLAAYNTQIGEGVGQNYAKASQALNTQLASQGGGNEFLPSGAAGALKSNLATAAANQQSQEQLAVTQANYATGRQNWQQATAGLNALVGEYNPNAIAGQATGATQGAFQDQTKVQDMKNQEVASIVGGITGLATGGLMGGLGNLDTTGSSSAGEQVGNFFSGFGQGV